MVRYLISLAIIVLTILGAAGVFFPDYWIHRYDELIARQARIYRLDEKLVWSLIYEETYFRAWKHGAADEVGLMQVRPAVVREWAKATELKEYERAADDPEQFLADPEQNIQVGCWYLEKLREMYRGLPAETALTLAAYNAGPSRVEGWTAGVKLNEISEDEFVSRITIPSTKSYVTAILARYRMQTSEIKK